MKISGSLAEECPFHKLSQKIKPPCECAYL